MRKTLLLSILLLASSMPTVLAATSPSILIFSKTTAFRNTSIPDGIKALQDLGAERGWRVDATEDATRFTDRNLRQYDVIVWLNTSGQVLTLGQRAAYERFHRSGKGTVAVYSGGVDTEREGWPWYRKLAWVSGEPSSLVREVTVMNLLEQLHPATFTFPYIRRESLAWYQLDPIPSILSTDAHVLLVAYDPAFPALFLPISWYKEFDGGRYFYTMLGGHSQDYSDHRFLAHLAGGIDWAAGRLPAKVSRKTEGDALILKEFDGVSPNGVWEKQAPSPDFNYEVKPGELYMNDSSAISMANRHLVRRGLSIDPNRPYSIEGTFTIPAPLDPNKPYSFCVNLNVAGADGDPRKVNTWAVNIHVLSPGKSVSKFMGFVEGGFFQVGQVENEWGDVGVEYHFEIHVNADLQALPRDKMVSLKVKKGDAILESFETDYSAFPYQPDYTKPVRFGLNGHGTAWVLRNLKIYYLDVPMPAHEPG